MSGGRQGSIAGYFTRAPPKAGSSNQIKDNKVKVKNEGVKDGVIDLTSASDSIHVSISNLGGDGDNGRSPKRRRLSPKPELEVSRASPKPISTISQSKPKQGRLTLESSQPFEYPGLDHLSYHPPPTPGYNHPYQIPPPPSALLEGLSFSQSPRGILRPSLNLDLLYFDQFIASPGSRMLYDYLLENLPWYRVKYTVRGININTPRWTTVFGKDSSTKSWTGYNDNVKPRAIPEILLRLMEIVEKVTGETYNFTLVNYYASGSDSISYHSDSESFLGPDPCIASLSLGSSRDFLLRHIHSKTNGAPIEKFALKDGDMVVMRKGTQANWMHSIPKRAGKGGVGGRINITFRKGVVKYATKNYLDYNVGQGGMYRWIKGEMVEQT